MTPTERAATLTALYPDDWLDQARAVLANLVGLLQIAFPSLRFREVQRVANDALRRERGRRRR